MTIQDERSVRRGKVSGEAQMLEHAAEVLASYQVLLKCTGRLQVLNAWTLLQTHLEYAHTSAFVSWEPSLKKIDTRCFTVHPNFLAEWMQEVGKHVSDEIGRDLESQSANWLIKRILAGSQVSDFNRSAALVGISGSTGIRYSKPKAHGRMLIERATHGRLRTDPRG